MPEFARNLAFVIGINNYTSGISALHNAVNDAKKLVEILRKQHDYQVWVCLDELATLKNLNKLLEEILPQQVEPDDRLLFYFAGHGIALNEDNGPQGYLIPQDAKLGDTATYLSMSQVQKCLLDLPCRHFLGILDCCFAGAFRWSIDRDLLTAPEDIYQEQYERFITDPAWQILTSAAYDQKALDAFNLKTSRGQIDGHSPFAIALFKALSGSADVYPPANYGKQPGDGVITATELYLYVRDHVERAINGYSLRQTPGIWQLKKHDKGEYIFFNPKRPLNLRQAPSLDEFKNPYRGLEAYEPEHNELFFGRTALIEKLCDTVCEQPLTVVLGVSGSGKSSLVKAGLIPHLKPLTQNQTRPNYKVDLEDSQHKHQHKHQHWEIIGPIRPDKFPIEALNLALKDFNAGRNNGNLINTLSAWSQKPSNAKVLLIIDQSEELITKAQNVEQEEFLDLLAQALKSFGNKLSILLTLRSEFEPQLKNTALEPYWTAGRFWVPAMSRSELREVIEEPYASQVIYFEPHQLVEQLINEVDKMPGALPLLSFALEQLYLKVARRYIEAQKVGKIVERAITQADYEELGGVSGALTQKAEQEYNRLVQQNPEYAKIIRYVLLRMVAVDGGLGRRQVPLSEFEYPEPQNKMAEEVIQIFLQARLFVSGEDIENNPYVEPAHDVLITGWGRLVKWIKYERETLLLQRRLTFAAERWKFQRKLEFGQFTSFTSAKVFWQREDSLKKKSAFSFLWSADPYLDKLKEVLNSPDKWLNKTERDFVRRSLKKRLINRLLRVFTSLPILIISLVLTINLLFSGNYLLTFLGIILTALSLSLFKTLLN